MIRVAVIDDHAVVLAGIKFVLSKCEDIEVVATAETADGIVRFWDESKADVLLLDIRMPGTGGLDALKTLLAVRPAVRVAMLTTSDLEEDVYRALTPGAAGYIPKDSRPEEIAAAVRAIARGGRYVPAAVQRIFDMRREIKGLSAREHEILLLASRGLSYPEIADMIGISVNSIKTHARHIFEKMGVEGRTEAVAAAISRGILDS